MVKLQHYLKKINSIFYTLLCNKTIENWNKCINVAARAYIIWIYEWLIIGMYKNVNNFSIIDTIKAKNLMWYDTSVKWKKN